MVRDRVTGWAIASVWVRFRVEVWVRLRGGIWVRVMVRLEVIRIRIRVRMRARVDVEVSVCFWGLQ